jgi:hypothetical protein
VETPFVGRTPIGNLAVVLGLYDAHDVLLAEDHHPDAPFFAALQPSLPAGTYYVKVSSYGEPGDVGQYTLWINETQGPRIVHAAYASLNATLATLSVTFDEPINPASFTPADVRINNGAGAWVW